jgi:sugar phosphate isomerase/epimerase
MIEKANADRKIRIGAGIVTWMDLSDRFTSYRKSTPIREAITQAATIPGIQGVEISRKNLPENIQEMKALLEELNMDLASLGAGL